jgi:hypothetical protein
MVLLGDEAQVEARFSPIGDSAKLDARLVHDLHRTYHRLSNSFRHNRWYSSVTRLKWKLDLDYSKIVLILMQDRSTVCAERTTALEIFLDAPDGTPR